MAALKAAAVAMSPGATPGDVEVVRREGSGPLLLVGGSGDALSGCVAHAGGLAVAVAARWPVEPVPWPTGPAAPASSPAAQELGSTVPAGSAP